MKRESTITTMRTAAPAAATIIMTMIMVITASAGIMTTIIVNAAFVFESDRPFDPARLDNYMRTLTQVYGPDMLRYKGVLYMTGTDRKMIFQGVHMLMAADLGKPWGDTKPSTKMVFIGRRLPKKAIMQGLETCLA